MPSRAAATDLTRIVQGARAGNVAETARLTELLYSELRELAARYLRAEGPGHTLQPTALVHEVYLRLISQRLEWNDRAHFFGIAAQTMRRVLLDHARRKHAAKRGGGIALTVTGPGESATDALDMVALDDALTRLGGKDARAARVVELHFFGGLEMAETAKVLGVSPATAKRDWSFARAWLRRELSAGATA
jgi:RNA polymerase sigma factor (TIGR02999 family)